MNVLRWAVPGVACAIFATVALGLEVAPGWVATHYTVRDGLPVNSVTDLEWSEDGYLWLTTFDGLVRFDGHQFTSHSRATHPSLPANRFTRIRADASGDMWLTTEQGDLVRRSPDGTFSDLTEDEQFPGTKVQCLERDPDGTLWICGDEGIAVLRDGAIERRPSAAGRDVRFMLVDAESRIWTAYAHEGVGMWESGREVRRFSLPAVRMLRETSSYGIVAGAADGLWRLETDGAAKITGDSPILGIQEDDQGRLLLQTGAAIHRWDGQQAELLASDGFANKSRGLLLTDALGRKWFHSSDMVRIDDEAVLSAVPTARVMIDGGNEKESVWIGTAGGLIHLRRSLFTTVGVEEGLDRLGIYPVVAGHDGSILAGTPGGGWMSVEPRSLEVSVHDEPKQVRTIVRDAGGQLWIGGSGLCRVTPEGCIRESSSPAPLTDVDALHLDRDGAMWVGAREGLYRRGRDGSWVDFAVHHRLPSRPVRVIADGLHGGLWLGTAGDGVLHWDGTRFLHFTMADGLPSDQIRALLVNTDDSVWIGTEDAGVVHARLDGESLRTVSASAADGLFDNGVHQILDDGLGRLWMSSNRGIFWVTRADLEAFVRGEKERVRSVFYDERHGLRNREANGGVQSAGTIDRDGRLWFPTQGGLVGIDPRKIPSRRDPPPVRLEGVTAGGTTTGAQHPVRLGPAIRDFSVSYTAIAFALPERVRFRYRLAGFDQDWVEASSRRTAFYTQVPPGNYSFQVEASYEGGDWGEAAGPLEIAIVPYFYETGWFRAGGIVILLSLLPLSAWGRTRHLERKRAELEQRIEARTSELGEALARVEEQAQALAELDRLKSRFFADVSHELRTPLTMIIGPLSDLLEVQREDEELHDQLMMMRRNALRLLRLVNQILDLHRLEAGGLEIEQSVRDLVHLVRHVSETFVPLAERNGIELRIALPKESVPVSIDPEQMEKVFGNLISNAVKFTPRGGSIDVTFSRDGSDAIVSVANTGTPIDAGDLERIFERFYRGPSTTLQEGTGIGLALVRELVERHQGSVSVTSIDDQTTFSVRLALASNEAAEAGVEILPVAPVALGPVPKITDSLRPNRRRATLLVVEDNPEVQSYIRTILAREYRLVMASNGADGLEKARRMIPDLIISDVMMPVMDGIQLVEALRNDPLTEPIPLILLTARATPSDEVTGLGSGADDYLAKPFSSEVLKARVASILERRKALRERLVKELVTRDEGREPSEPFDVLLRNEFERLLGEETFSILSLAGALGMSRASFDRRVQQTFDRSPGELLLEWRLERARELLRSDDAAISEVAYATGFRSLAHFSRTFQNRFGVPPSRWKRRLEC